MYRALPVFLCLSLFASSCFAAARHKLVVISIDGLDARLLNDADRLKVKIPNIRKLMRSGAYATGVVGVLPTQTWPAHTSMVTGVPPREHGVTKDDESSTPPLKFFAANNIRTTTLWQAATAAGLKAALVFWPETVGANVAFNFPEFWEGSNRHAIDAEPIGAKAVPNGIALHVAKMFPSFDKQLWDDASSAQAAIYLLSKENPDVLLVHMAELDAEQHDTAALSIYAREILENDDEWIGQILAKIEPGTVVAVVSDHGFENDNYLVRPRVALQQAKFNGRVEVLDGLIGTADQATAQYLRKNIGNRKMGIAREIPIDEVRSRAPELSKWVAAFDTFTDQVASPETKGPAVGPGKHQGVHDFWPSHKDYRSVFVICGEGIHPRKLPEIDMLEIAPTLADAIGVKLPQAKKKSLWPMLTK